MVTTLVTGACGGKEGGREDGALDGGPILAPVAPTCAAICTHVVGTCVPGANIDACVMNCDRARVQFASCPQYLDAYLVCVSHARVECQTDVVVIVDCSPERNVLETCVH